MADTGEDSARQSEQQLAPKVSTLTPQSVPSSGGRPAFHDLKRNLSDDELAGTGARKLLLDILESAERERDEYKTYVERFHTADRIAAVQAEKLKGNKVNEVLFGVGVGVGGAILGLAPLFYDKDTLKFVLALVLGILLTGGATLGRILCK